ncbi:G-type lectin S-receptor-like serine/threonine-protein kinase At4g27290 [Cryptomeria japonica]|uniref:G-type lectin S-receptor-like serine/threonine-protein kinase At4g27290 n=1 Tax=Cryptomeria japonica TaxID=3369 RepID=UPI0027DA48C7|nr:G-type lectin S-receptor-like serine/threonine-protein kinase At4g27290 [Cryptomeria japonica]
MDSCQKNLLAFSCLKRFILVLVMLVLQRNCDLLVAGGDTLFIGASLRGKQTISSKSRKVIWSSNDTQQAKASRALILDTGNFVLLGAQNTSETVWESFAHATDHFMPTMKFWKGMKVNSWKSSVDPAPGPFFFQMNPSPGEKDFLLEYKNGVSYYSSGNWTGKYYSNVPQAVSDTSFEQELVEFSPTRLYYTYNFTPKVRSTALVRYVLNFKGELRFYYLSNNTWSLVYNFPLSNCAVYGLCGAYGVCFTQENIQSCSCMEGFYPRNATAWSSQEWWSSGCIRRTPLDCSAINVSASGTTDDFLQVSNISLSDKEAVQYTQESTVEGCKTACLDNCSCTAFAFTDSNSVVCKLWFGDLLGIQAKDTSSEDQPLFIRLAASDVSQLSAHAGRSSSRVVVLSISIPMGVAVLGTLFM